MHAHENYISVAHAFSVLQAIWVAALAVALPVALHKKWLDIPYAHVEILAGAAAIGSVIAELFMIKSLVVFDPKISADPVVNGHEEPASPRYSRTRVRHSISGLHIPQRSTQALHLLGGYVQRLLWGDGLLL